MYLAFFFSCEDPSSFLQQFGIMSFEVSLWCGLQRERRRLWQWSRLMYLLPHIIIFAVSIIKIRYLDFFIIQPWILDPNSLFSPSLPTYPWHPLFFSLSPYSWPSLFRFHPQGKWCIFPSLLPSFFHLTHTHFMVNRKINIFKVE